MFWTIIIIWLVIGVIVNIAMIGTDDKKEQNNLKTVADKNNRLGVKKWQLLQRRKELLTQITAYKKSAEKCWWAKPGLEKRENDLSNLDKEIAAIEAQKQELQPDLLAAQREVEEKQKLYDRRWRRYIRWPVYLLGVIVIGVICWLIGLFWYVACGGFLLWHEDTFFGKLAMGLFSLVLLVIAIVGVIEVFRKN